jgi:predicted dehydrogenase
MAKRALVVGCGGMGRAWIRNVLANPRAELVGVVDLNAEAAQKGSAEGKLDPARAFTDLRKAIKVCRPDFVVDVTVPEGHCPTTVTALGKGLPVLGEKPMADSMAAAKKMVKAAEKAQRLYMVSQSRRYDGIHQSLTRELRGGAIGDLTTLNCDFYLGAHFGGFRDEMPSPLILDMSIHHFDLARLFAGSDPVAVYAKEFNPKGSWYRGDVAASAIFEFAGGVIFTYRGSWCADGCHTSWHGDWRLIGSRGTVVYERDQPARGQRVKPGGKAGFNSELEDVPLANSAQAKQGIAGSLDEFLDALDGKVVPQGECHDNIKSLAMVFAAIKSAKLGKRVPVVW